MSATTYTSSPLEVLQSVAPFINQMFNAEPHTVLMKPSLELLSVMNYVLWASGMRVAEDATEARCRELIEANQFVGAIKHHRNEKGSSLKGAKDAMDALKAKMEREKI